MSYTRVCAAWLALMFAALPTHAQDSMPGNDPAAWLEHASVHARRVTGSGGELTSALQLKGELLANIAAFQSQLGQTTAADKNLSVVSLCLRALKHDNEDGWVRASHAWALARLNRADAARAELDKITNPAERAIAAQRVAQLLGQTSVVAAPASELLADTSPGFRNQFNALPTRTDIRQKAIDLTADGSVDQAVQWLEPLERPAVQAFVSLSIAEALMGLGSQTADQAQPDHTPTDTPIDPPTQTVTASIDHTPVEVARDAQHEAALAEDATATQAPNVAEQATLEPAVAIPAASASPSTDASLTTNGTSQTEVQAEAQPAAEPTAQASPTQIQIQDIEAAINHTADAAGSAVVEAVAVTGASVAAISAVDEAEADQASTDPGTTAEAVPQDPDANMADVNETAAASPAESPSAATNAPSIGAEPVVSLDASAEPQTLTQTVEASEAVSAEAAAQTPDDTTPAEEDSTPTAATPALAEEPNVGDASPALADDAATPSAVASPAPPVTPSTEAAPVAEAAPPPITTKLNTLSDPHRVLNDSPAPSEMDLRFVTTAGEFVVRVHRDWAPAAADRFEDLCVAGFYDNQRVFRVVPGFVAQWGIHGYPDIAAAWRSQTFPDEKRTQTNRRGTIAFAAAAKPHTRTTQVYINLGDNLFLDDLGFTPFGQVLEGMDVVETLFGGYHEKPSQKQREIQLQGNAFLDANYPKLDSIVSVEVVR